MTTVLTEIMNCLGRCLLSPEFWFHFSFLTPVRFWKLPAALSFFFFFSLLSLLGFTSCFLVPLPVTDALHDISVQHLWEACIAFTFKVYFR